ncbi:MAG TPA: Hcp family type VI secretion system effector [Gammaproteobacteria bacterium]|nr:Hcp family type VI secretion system effector [Gammaproteobacteria bacterium]
MPTPGHLSLVGETQGEIEGSCQIEGREDSILVQAFRHIVDVPSDENGLPSGRRVHRPLMITKDVDKSSPKLFQVLCSGERLSQAKLDWYRLDGTGEETLFFSVLLQNAQIVKIESWVPDVLDRGNASYGNMENVWFTYETIRWTWEEDGIEYEENWDAQAGNR